MTETEENEAARFSAYIEHLRDFRPANIPDVEEAFFAGWDAKHRRDYLKWEAVYILGWFWKEWRGGLDGRPAMLIRTLFSRWGYRIDLHKFIRADDETCFHTHPAKAWRVIVWGGYTEELREENYSGRFLKVKTTLKTRRPGFVGLIRPETCHRIDSLRNGKSSYSLWLRGRKSAEVKIVGQC